MSSKEQKSRRRQNSDQQLVAATPQQIIQQEISQKRHEEIRKYLELFGYKPEHSILQVHEAGSFGQRARPPKEIATRANTAARYGGRTFTVVGRTHDATLLMRLIPPRKKDPESGYRGYLFKEKDQNERTPDELLPLDFTPAPLRYPRDWKDALGSLGYLITMHVPSDFARKKNELIRKLSRIKGNVDVKKNWRFLDELKEFGYNNPRVSDEESRTTE